MEGIMKKIVLTATMVVSLFILGCGGGTKDTAVTSEKKSEPATAKPNLERQTNKSNNKQNDRIWFARNGRGSSF